MRYLPLQAVTAWHAFSGILSFQVRYVFGEGNGDGGKGYYRRKEFCILKYRSLVLHL